MRKEWYNKILYIEREAQKNYIRQYTNNNNILYNASAVTQNYICYSFLVNENEKKFLNDFLSLII